MISSEVYPKLGENNRVNMGQQILQNPVSGTMPHAPGMPHTPGINYVNGMGYLDLGTGTGYDFFLAKITYFLFISQKCFRKFLTQTKHQRPSFRVFLILFGGFPHFPTP